MGGRSREEKVKEGGIEEGKGNLPSRNEVAAVVGENQMSLE